MDMSQALLVQHQAGFAFTHMSNVMGSIQTAREIIAWRTRMWASCWWMGRNLCRIYGDVTERDAEFLAFFGHRCRNPTVLEFCTGMKLLERYAPFLGGGDMIKKVTLHGFTSKQHSTLI
jgi:cysteine desulfurase/selenocysteine lyase